MTTTTHKWTPETAPPIDSPRISSDGGGGGSDPESFYTDSQTGESIQDCWITLLVDGEEVYSSEWKQTSEQDWEPTKESVYSDWIEEMKA